MGNTETSGPSPPQSTSELRKSIMATSTTTMTKANRLPQPEKGELERRFTKVLVSIRDGGGGGAVGGGGGVVGVHTRCRSFSFD